MQHESNFQTKPLPSFVRSKLNVRKKKGTNIEELAALILSQGLLQNLIGCEQHKKGKPTGIIEVVAGGRRLEALQLLASRGQIPEDYPVHFKLVSEEEAITLSLAENSGREPMHPADQFEAMRELINQNKPLEDVAAAFGLSPLTVQRRLKLANVSPKLFALYRDDKIHLDQLMALAITDDHAAQEQVWDSLPSYNRHANTIRQLLTKDEVDLRTDPIARFVGAEAYEQAGGTIRRDLFSDEANGTIQDAALLEKLANAKLSQVAQAIEWEGWAWIDTRLRLDYSERATYGRARMVRRDPTDEEWVTIQALADEQEKLEAEFAQAEDDDNADHEALERRQADLEERQEAIESALESPDPADQAISGALVTIGHNGDIEILRGLIRAGDARKGDDDEGTAAEDRAEKPVHSDRLTRQLTAHRTAALQAVLTTRPDMALVALTHSLAQTVFQPCGTDGIVQVSMRQPTLKTDAPNIEESRAWKAFQAAHERWAERLADFDGQALFAWLLEQPQAVLLELMAFCTACSLNAVTQREQASPGFAALAQSVNLNMADWWSPTKDNYLGHVPKLRIIDVVKEAVSAEAAHPLAKMKKESLIATAERSLAGTGWLPDVLKAA